MRMVSHLKSSTRRVALLLLLTISSRSLAARALSSTRLSLSTGHCDDALDLKIGNCCDVDQECWYSDALE